ncbi:MAG: cation diffusion facilitator family transporter [Verrucomicrobiota bacterium]
MPLVGTVFSFLSGFEGGGWRVMDGVVAKSASDSVLRRAIYLSFGVGVLMLGIKVGASLLTGSSAILGDAAESVVHVVAVAFVVFSLRLSQKPPDESHLYGHAKISFFSAGFEGALIALAGLFIIYNAIGRWVAGLEVQNIGPGTGLVALALGINGALSWYLLRLGNKHDSLILRANGHHILADVWTSFGVLAGLGLVVATGWHAFDPICALLIALNILRSGISLMRESVGGLMDRADPKVTARVEACLDEQMEKHGISYHRMRHRDLGTGHWVDLHLVFDDEVSVKDAHAVATEVERAVREDLGGTTVVTTHLEPKWDRAHAHGTAAKTI